MNASSGQQAVCTAIQAGQGRPPAVHTCAVEDPAVCKLSAAASHAGDMKPTLAPPTIPNTARLV